MSETITRVNQTIGTISTTGRQVETTLAFGGWALCLYPSSDSSDYRDLSSPSAVSSLQMGHRQCRSLLQGEKQAGDRRRVWQICRGEREFSEGDKCPAGNLHAHRTSGNQPIRTGLFAGTPCDRRCGISQRAA